MVLSFQNLRKVSFCNVDDSEQLAGQELEALFFLLNSISGELLYVSEEVPFAVNVHFGAVSLPDLMGMLQTISIKLWGRRQGGDQYVLLYNMYVGLHKLVCLNTFTHIFDSNQLTLNSLVLGFHGTYFAPLDDIKDPKLTKECSPFARYARRKTNTTRDSYSFDNIRGIGRLLNGINDFKAAKLSLSDQIDSAADSMVETPLSEKLVTLKISIHMLQKVLAKQRSAYDELMSSVLAKERQVKTLESALEEQVPPYLELITERIDIVKSEVAPLYEALEFSVYPDMIETLRTVFLVVRDVFPIELRDSGKGYSIAGIEVPTSAQEILYACYNTQTDVETIRETTIEKFNAGLSIVIQLILHISSIMDLKLKYSIVQKESSFFLVEFCSQKSQEGQANISGKYEVTVANYPLFYDPQDTEKVAKTAGPFKSYESKNHRFERALLLLKTNLIALSSDIMSLYSKYLYGKTERIKLPSHIPNDCADNFVWTLNYMLLFVTAPL